MQKKQETKIKYIAFPDDLKFVKAVKMHSGLILLNSKYTGTNNLKVDIIKGGGATNDE